MRIGLSAFAERLRGSLFVVPMIFVIGGIVLAQLGIALDASLGRGATELPLGLTSTVQSARAVLSTVAGATITVAGIAFSVSLLTIQLASSQYSPRVVSGLFRDPFNKRVIGIVVGTFSYCLVLLRSVRSPLEDQGKPVIPNVSVGFGVVLGIVAILAIIAFIDHNAHTMDISEILDVVTRDAIRAVDRHWSTGILEPSPAQRPDALPAGPGHTIRFDQNGWVQLLDTAALLAAAPEGGTVCLDTAVGRYAIRGSPICTIWPEPADRDDAEHQVRGAIHTGETRTLQQDATYGIRQLADVGLKALSPGINDPTTAQDAIFHLGAVLHAFLLSDPPARDLCNEGRRLVLAHADGHADVVSLAYDEIRLAAAAQPTVSIYLLDGLHLLDRSLEHRRQHENHEIGAIIEAEANLVMAACEHSDLAVDDIQRVRQVYTTHFDH